MNNIYGYDFFNKFYEENGGGSYTEKEKWEPFFDKIAQDIIDKFNPKTVLDAGCAMGYLVEALRKKGVEAYGIDVSEYAIKNVDEKVKQYCFVHSIVDKLPDSLPKKFDLIVTIEVLEHLCPEDGTKAIKNLCKYSDTIIFTSTPDDIEDATHVNVQQAEYWCKEFAKNSFFKDHVQSVDFICPWAMLFRKRDNFENVIFEYEMNDRIEKMKLNKENKKENVKVEKLIKALESIDDLFEEDSEPSEQTLVTVIVPVYNGEKYLRKNIDSVLAQTYKNWELVLVNDGSSDSSVEIIEEYLKKDSRIRLINQENAGQSSARNNGAKAAKGEYLAFLDQDDYYTPEHLESLVKILDEYPEVGMAYDEAEVIDKDGNREYNREAHPFRAANNPLNSIIDCIKDNILILPGTTMIRKNIFLEVGGFDTDLIGYEDDHLFVRIFRKSKIKGTPSAGLMYRLHGGNTSSSIRTMCRSRILYYRKLRKMLPDVPERNIFYSSIMVPRFLICILPEVARARKFKDKDALRDLYNSWKELDPKPFKYRLITIFISPNCPNFMFSFAKKMKRLFRL